MKANFDNSYAELPDALFRRQNPIAVSSPTAIARNEALAENLGIQFENDWVDVVAGNVLPNGASPITQAYAGHQFGHWNPQLGDGRAVLLGEVVNGQDRFDLQLKGSGPTHWSRGGDGRAWVGPVLREFVVSEAMHHLGVPTTRALAMVFTGDPVVREQGPLPGAVLARVAPSHIRVGTFQYFAARQDHTSLNALFEHTRMRHFPNCNTSSEVLQTAVDRQAKLIARWMGLGFIHGVMNTDNAHVAGISIDYGPCAFMDTYHPMKVFSSIDHQGRYAFGNQPQIAAWNMAQFATALLPMMDDRDGAIADFTNIVESFGKTFEQAYRAEYCAKLGLPDDPSSDILIQQFLTMMFETAGDFTESFASLEAEDVPVSLKSHSNFADWHSNWTSSKTRTPENPMFIPRNHLVQHAIDAAVTGDLTPFHDLWDAAKTPFAQPDNAFLTTPPKPEQVVTQTFCGT